MNYREWYSKKCGVRDELRREQEKLSAGIASTESRVVDLTEARDTLNAVMVLTHEGIRSFIEEVVTLALGTVYGGEASFSLEYQVKRNQWEARCYIVSGGERVDPRSNCAGGVLDVAAFGLRLTLWALSRDRSAPVFVFDEPFKFVSPDLQPKVAEALKVISDLLGIQIIMVSHVDALIMACDAAYRVEQRGGISQVGRIVV